MLRVLLKGCDVELKGLASILHSYQEIIRELLKTYSLLGVGAHEFERFKEDFATAAFTCRAWRCPLASTGFKTGALRDEHERAHLPRLSCDISGCRYPVFPSISALKNHKSKHHPQGAIKIRIQAPRTTGNLPSRAGTISRERGSESGGVSAGPEQQMRFKLLHEMNIPADQTRKFIQFSRDGTSLAVGYEFHVRLFNISSDTITDSDVVIYLPDSNIGTSVSCACYVTCASLGPHESCLMVGTSNGAIRVSCFSLIGKLPRLGLVAMLLLRC